MTKKIYRSKSNRIISGVCGGLGEYFNIDPVIIRLFWALLSAWTNGNFIILYIVCAIIIPEDNGSVVYYENDNSSNKYSFQNNAMFIGIALIVVGITLLAKMLCPQFFLKFYNLRKYWPTLLIIAGIYILYKQYNQK